MILQCLFLNPYLVSRPCLNFDINSNSYVVAMELDLSEDEQGQAYAQSANDGVFDMDIDDLETIQSISSLVGVLRYGGTAQSLPPAGEMYSTGLARVQASLLDTRDSNKHGLMGLWRHRLLGRGTD
jgi:hypothetical protein